MRWAWLVIGSALVFIGSGIAVGVGATREIDAAFTRWLQGGASETFDSLANVNTIIGQSTVGVALAIVLALFLRARGPRWAWIAPLLIALTAVLELAGKVLLVHPAPPSEFVRTSFNPLGIHLATTSSWPSGHIARTTFLAIVTSAIWPSLPVKLLLAVLVVATPFARIYLGDHWLSDAVGGVALGALVGTLAAWWLAHVRGGATA